MLTQIEGFDATATRHPRRKTYGVKVGHVQVGGGAPIVVQSMTNTDTADIESTFKQTVELADDGRAAADRQKALLDFLHGSGCFADVHPPMYDFVYNFA